MHTATVEIYSDTSNAAVLRHPDRRFPGVLIQGDTLHSLCLAADAACQNAKTHFSQDAYGDLKQTRVVRQGDNCLSFYEPAVTAQTPAS